MNAATFSFLAKPYDQALKDKENSQFPAGSFNWDKK